MTLYDRIRRLCNGRGIDISNLGEHLPDANVSKSTISHWKNGTVPRAALVKAMADYFDVSTEYILTGKGASNEPAGVKEVVAGRAPVAIIDGYEKKLSEQEVALLELYKELDVVQRAKLIAYASEL